MIKSLVKLFLIVLLAVLLIVSTSSLVKAQSITGLNAEISSLRTRINRLESDVRNLSRAINYNRNIPSIPNRELPSSSIDNPPAIDDNTVVGRSDPLFKRLANLVIELKEDVRDLDRRLTTIEESQKPKT